MLSKDIISKILKKCLVTGGDFAEIFEDDSISNSISLVDGKVDDAIGGRSYGIGIRIFKGLKSVYAYTCLLYTSDAADDTPCVDLGGRRIIKKKKKKEKKSKQTLNYINKKK
eukprot:TRINITY_DN17710_c0_g1_i2.p2 TRINITY_DN17710_c0_g1~~TRINITY_DN17710_c0_g1_i2.p2  ORF type:complete len:112 (+),score=28.66 TRINITY_DN17710_c0_g1_i2:88-423(+)